MGRPFLTPHRAQHSSQSSPCSSPSPSDEDSEPMPRHRRGKRGRRRKTRGREGRTTPRAPSASPSPPPSPIPDSNPNPQPPTTHDGGASLPPGRWNTNYAVAHLVNHLRASTSTSTSTPTAADAIAAARTYPVPPRQWRAYPGLVFASLSAGVFGGTLGCGEAGGACEVGWGMLDEGVSGRTVVVDGGGRKQRGRRGGEDEEGGGGGEEEEEEVRVTIELNAAALRGASRDEIVGTLLHHMIHAYLLVVCGGGGGGGGGGDRAGKVGGRSSCNRRRGQRHENWMDEEEFRQEGEEGAESHDEDHHHHHHHLAHGNAFAAILWEIRAQAAKGEDGEVVKRPLPIGFGHRLPSAYRQFVAERSLTKKTSASNSSTESSGINSSRKKKKKTMTTTTRSGHVSRGSGPLSTTHCPAVVPIVTLDAASAWHASECAPFLAAPPCVRSHALYACESSTGAVRLVPRDDASAPASAYVEFIFDGDKPIGVPRATVERFASLAGLFENGQKRWVELPRAAGVVGRAELGALMAFLRRRAYGPELRPRRGRRGSGGGGREDDEEAGEAGGDGRSGVPVIKLSAGTVGGSKGIRRGGCYPSSSESEEEKQQSHGPAHLLHDIRVYRLADALGFTELAACALRRLYNDQVVTYEDPIDLLDTLYFSGTGEVQLPQQLRAWAQSFLCRRDSAPEVSNISKLSMHPALKVRWNDLLARRGEGARMLLDDIKMIHAREAAKRPRWKCQKQYAGISYLTSDGKRRPLYAHNIVDDDLDISSAKEDESNQECIWDSPHQRPRTQYNNRQPRNRINRSQLSMQQTPFPQHPFLWWSQASCDFPYSCHCPQASFAVPQFPYYAAPHAHSPHKQLQATRIQSTGRQRASLRCKASKAAEESSAGISAATRSPAAMASQRSRERAAAVKTVEASGYGKYQEDMGSSHGNLFKHGDVLSGSRRGRNGKWSSSRRRRPRVNGQ